MIDIKTPFGKFANFTKQFVKYVFKRLLKLVFDFCVSIGVYRLTWENNDDMECHGTHQRLP